MSPGESTPRSCSSCSTPARERSRRKRCCRPLPRERESIWGWRRSGGSWRVLPPISSASGATPSSSSSCSNTRTWSCREARRSSSLLILKRREGAGAGTRPGVRPGGVRRGAPAGRLGPAGQPSGGPDGWCLQVKSEGTQTVIFGRSLISRAAQAAGQGLRPRAVPDLHAPARPRCKPETGTANETRSTPAGHHHRYDPAPARRLHRRTAVGRHRSRRIGTTAVTPPTGTTDLKSESVAQAQEFTLVRGAVMTTSAPATAARHVGSAPLGSRRWLALSLLSLAQLMLILDVTVVNVALPAIGAGLHLDRPTLTWVLTAYTLAFGGLMLLGGRLADLFGARRVMLTGLAVFTAASLLGGLAANGPLLIGSRAAQGVGAALLSPSALSLVTTTFTGAERNKALGIWAAIGGAGSAIGVLAGGVLTSAAGWRWIFFINVPVGLLVLAALPALVAGGGHEPAARSTRAGPARIRPA